MPDLISFCFNVKDKNHLRACCILEKVLELKIELIRPYLNLFCSEIHKLKNDSAIRSVSRFLMLLAKDNGKNRAENSNYLTRYQSEKITETCFDWLISDIRVAPKVKAARTLFEIGKNQEWIYPELKTILEQEAYSNSAAYKACAKDILKRINKT